jgi:hypothetical protein
MMFLKIGYHKIKIRPNCRGFFSLSNGITPSKISYFLADEIWTRIPRY